MRPELEPEVLDEVRLLLQRQRARTGQLSLNALEHSFKGCLSLSFLLKARLFFPFDMLIILDLVELVFRPDDSCANIGVTRKVLTRKVLKARY